MCAKCGAMLCEDCSLVVGSRRYCESCLVSDDKLIKDFQFMLSRQLQLGKIATIVDYDGPQKWSEVPSALLNMLKDSDIFFRGAYKTPYAISFPIAYLALLPNSLITYVVKFDEIAERYMAEFQSSQNADVVQAVENLQTFLSMPAAVYGVALLTPVIQILVLDVCLYASLWLFMRRRFTFSQAGALVNFSLIPFGLTAVATWFSSPLIYYIALGLMIVNLSSAVRSSTNCTFMQGLGVMLLFIFAATFSNVLFAVV